MFPTNFPVEFFYFVADSDKIDTPGCGGVLPGIAKYRGAVEGSFLTGVQQPGQQSGFARTKIVASGLCPNTTYTFTHPYGVDLITTNTAGQVIANKKGGTIDVGCLAAPCDFTLALASRVFGGFLQLSPPAPGTAGYLGDKGPVAGTLGTVTGSPLGTNFFQISGPAGLVGTTNLFTVSGKLAGPLMASPTAIDFGGQAPGTTSLPQIVTVTNVYPATITPSAAAIVGAGFAVAADGCLGVPLIQDQSCPISVTFNPSPTAIGRVTAELDVPHNGPFRSPLKVALAGTATSGTPAASLSATSLPFGSVRVRTTSAAQTVTLSNTGTAPLGPAVTIVNADPALFNAAADQFAILNDTCSGKFIDAGASCTVSVAFAPTVAAASTAVLNFADNAAGSPQSVTLTGTGTGGIAAVSTTLNPFGYPDWYQDENGVQLQPCLNPAEPCVLLGDPNYDPLVALSFPTTPVNFPTEFFYFVADSDKMDAPGCPGVSLPGPAVKYRAALEGSFLTGAAVVPPGPIPPGVVQAGQQSGFTRTRIVVAPGGLCPNTRYSFTHPYGTDLVTTDATGGVIANKKGATIDTGCLGAPCDFSLALKSRVFGGLLKWDPAVAPAAPAGFLGDKGPVAGTPHAVIGTPYIPPGETGAANFFRIADATTGAVLNGCANALGVVGPCQVDLFTVSGKLAVPVQTSQVFAPGAVTFPPTILGITSAAQTVTLKNADPLNSVLIGAATVLTTPGGAASLDFTKGLDNCSGVTLAAGATCTIDVVFNPTAVGLLAGALVVPHGGLNSPAEVPLSGTGLTAVNQPPVAANDSATTPAGTAVSIAVLANDIDPDGNIPLTVANLTQPITGTAVLNANNTVTYTPPAGFSGTVSFTYQAQDSLGARSNVATVTVTVTVNAVAETITATAQASINRQRTAASWTVNGTTTTLTTHTMTVTLTRTGAQIGTPATTDAKGRWKVSAGKSPIIPSAGDTITVTSSLGTTATFPVTIK